MFWVALCLAITVVSFLRVKHFIPYVAECILRGFKPLLLIIQAPRGGNKSLVEVLLFQVFFRDDEFIIVWTILFSGDRLLNFTLGIGIV